MQIQVESVLFTDPECQRPTGFCPCCGQEIYDGHELCRSCREDSQ